LRVWEKLRASLRSTCTPSHQGLHQKALERAHQVAHHVGALVRRRRRLLELALEEPDRHGVALQVAFERLTLKPVSSLDRL
jgi:hypothetical protein